MTTVYYVLTPIFQGCCFLFFFHLKPKQQKFFTEILGYFFTVYAATTTIYYFRKHSKEQIRRDANISLFGYWIWDHMWYLGKEGEKYSTSENNESLLCTFDPLMWGTARWRQLQIQSLMQGSKVGNSWKVGRIAQIWRQSVQRNRKETFTRNTEESNKNAPKPFRAAGVKTWLEERSHPMKTQMVRPHLFSDLLNLQLSHSAEPSSL